MNKKFWAMIGRVCLILAFFQSVRIGVKAVCFLFMKRTNVTDRMASLIAMVVLTIFLIILSNKQKITLSVFPKKFGWKESIASCIAAFLFISTPVLTKEYKCSALLMLLYSSIILPVFEELLFRGYVWNTFAKANYSEWNCYLISTLLFGLWHLGYVDSIAYRVHIGLVTAMIWKVITGIVFGLILGAVRYRVKNCYLTMLLHGVLNLFGR